MEDSKNSWMMMMTGWVGVKFSVDKFFVVQGYSEGSFMHLWGKIRSLSSLSRIKTEPEGGIELEIWPVPILQISGKRMILKNNHENSQVRE